MKKVIALAGTALAIALGSVLLAPSVWAMVPPPEPGGGASGSSTSPTITGIAVWQVVAIAIVAVVIGALGTSIAQRTHRHADTSSVSMA
jgi:hypothetical protein